MLQAVAITNCMTVAVSHITVDESLTHSSVQRCFGSLKLHFLRTAVHYGISIRMTSEL